MKKLLFFILIILALIGTYFYYFVNQDLNLEGFAKANGRLETTQVDISSKLSGRLIEVNVQEGDFVEKGQILAKIDVKEQNSKLQEVISYKNQAIENKKHSLEIVKQKESELSLAQKDFDRANKLFQSKSIPLAEYQKRETELRNARIALNAAKTQISSSNAVVDAFDSQIETTKINIEEANLYSPTKGRVLYKIAQNGEIVANGGKVLVVLDLIDTYMTVFLPTSQAGLVDIGTEARIVLDAVPDIAIPAKVSFVSPLAQFTPKEIETKEEREKLMFRVKVKIEPKLLEKYYERIKTGLPAVAYIKLNENAVWPEFLNNLAEY